MDEANASLIEHFFTAVRITDELCDSSIVKYRDSIKNFLSTVGDKRLADLGNNDFALFVLKMKDSGASNSRISNVISAMKKLIEYLQKEKFIGMRINLSAIRKPKIERRTVNYLSEDEVALFLGAITRDIQKGEMIRKVRMMALAMLLLQTGARIGEALSIKIKDIDRMNMEIPIIGKGRKPRSLFLTQATLDWMDRYIAVRGSDHPALFLTLSGQSRWQQTDVGRSFRRYKNLSGIAKPIVLHTLRHTTATLLTLKGVPMNTIQHILGHERLETTIRYYIGATEKRMAKQVMQDQFYQFIPKESLARLN
jgi:integrase/recombinase XerD